MCLFFLVDLRVKKHALFGGIIDHRKKGTGTTGASQTTKGWELCVQWADGTINWSPLKELKDSNPIEAAEYAALHSLLHEDAFKWWARKTLKRRDAYIGKVKTRYWKRTHKFGIEMLKSVKDALVLDKQLGTRLWLMAGCHRKGNEERHACVPIPGR